MRKTKRLVFLAILMAMCLAIMLSGTFALAGETTDIPEIYLQFMQANSSLPPPNLNIKVDKTQCTVGDKVSVTWSVPEGVVLWRIFFITPDQYGNDLFREVSYRDNAAEFVTLTAGEGYFSFLTYKDTDIEEEYEEYPIVNSAKIVIKESIPQPLPFNCTITPAKTSAAVGEPIEVTIAFSGGAAPYTIQSFDTRYWQGNPQISEVKDGKATVMFDAPCRNQLVLEAEDTAGAIATFTSPWIDVTGEALSCTVQFDKLVVPFGQSVTATLNIQGGVPPYTTNMYFYTDGGDHVRFPENAATATFTPQKGIKGRVSGFVSDSTESTYARHIDSEYFSISYDHLPPFTASVAIDKTVKSDPKEEVTVTWQVEGGKAPIVIKGGWGSASAVLEGNSLTSANPSSTSYFYLEATDDDGRTIKAKSPECFVNTTDLITITFDKTQLKAGEEVTGNWGMNSPQPVAKYYYSWSLSDEFVDRRSIKNGNGTATSDTIIAPEAGRLNLYVWACAADDSRIATGSRSIEVTQAETPFDIAINLDKTTVNTGDPIKATWAVTGDPSTYTLSAKWWQLTDYGSVTHETKIEDLSLGVSTLTPRDSDKGYFLIEAVNADGIKHIFKSPEFRITGNPTYAPLKVTVTLDKNNVRPGDIVTASYQIEGGVPPYRVDVAQWEISNKPGEDYLVINGTPKDGKISLKVPEGMSGLINVEVADNFSNYTGGISPVFSIETIKTPGDADGDGQVSISDLVTIVNYLIDGTMPASGVNADVDGSGKIDINDLLLVIKRIIG
jgi:hypothetical protein